MASVTLSQSSEYRLVHQDHDWLGWAVHDREGHLIGRVTDFIIDTEASRAVALLLDTGSEIPLNDVLVGERSLTVWREEAPLPVEAPSWQAFEAGTFDVPEHAEVAVFTKRRVVIEELLISSDVVGRTERIHTTVRRRDVEVEPISARSSGPSEAPPQFKR